MKTSMLGLAATIILTTSQAAAVAIAPRSTKLLAARQKLGGTVLGTGVEVAQAGLDTNGFDTPICLWQATGPGGVGAVNFYLQIPNWQATFSKDTAINDLKGSLGGNAACASGEKTFFQWNIIGDNTVAADVFVSSFCTAYEMTKVIAATTGKPGIACTPASSQDSPDGPKPDSPDPVDGSDGYDDPDVDPGVKRRDEALDQSHTVWIKGGP